MNPALLLKFSQSKFVRVLDFILPSVALLIGLYYFIFAHDNTNGAIWVGTGIFGLILSIANITKLMNRFMISRLKARG